MSGSSAGFLHMLFTVNVTRPQVCPLDTQAHAQIRREKRPERRKPRSDPSANNIPECQISWIGAQTFWHDPLAGVRTGIRFSCWVCLYVLVCMSSCEFSYIYSFLSLFSIWGWSLILNNSKETAYNTAHLPKREKCVEVFFQQAKAFKHVIHLCGSWLMVMYEISANWQELWLCCFNEMYT